MEQNKDKCLQAINITKKIGKEQFYIDGKQLSLNILSFWQWSSSDLLGNALRGKLAEFIVASSINVLDKPREEWDAFDLITKNGLKIEIKSSAYLQSWHQTKLSKIVFGIQQTIAWDSKTNLLSKEPMRQSDIYIFCVLNHQDKKTVDPLNLSQWSFYILETSVLNDKLGNQKTITLSSLLKLNPIKTDYINLKNEIYKKDDNI